MGGFPLRSGVTATKHREEQRKLVMVDTRYWTVAEIAAMLHVSKKSVYEWVKSGELKAVDLGSQTKRVQEEDLQQFLTERKGEE